MIYQIKVEYTYRLGEYSSIPLTRTIETQKFFSGEDVYARAVECVEKYGRKDNSKKFGVRVYLSNGMYAPPVKVSDNYVLSADDTNSSAADILFMQIERDIFSPVKTNFWLTKWTILSILVFGVLFSFKMCKMEWDEEVNPYNARNWKGEDYYHQKAVGDEIEKQLEKIDKGESPLDFRFNGDTCKEDLTWRPLSGGKKAYRRLFLKKILMAQPDLYTDKDGKRLQFPRADIRYHNYIEAEIENDTLHLYGLSPTLHPFRKKMYYSDFEEYITREARKYVDCKFVRIKAFTYNKIYAADYPGKEGNFEARIIYENKKTLVRVKTVRPTPPHDEYWKTVYVLVTK